MRTNDVTLTELQTAIGSALATGRLGTIVNVRLHWQIPDGHVSSRDAILTAAAIADQALELGPTRWRCRAAEQGRLIHLLGTDDRGRTLVVTVGVGFDAEVQLTVFGNHGVLRLDYAELHAESVEPGALAQKLWFESLARVLEDGLRYCAVGGFGQEAIGLG